MTSKKCSYPPPLNRQQTADYLGYSVSTMNKKAKKKKPPFHKKGGESFYFLTDLEEYEKEQQTF